MNINNINLTSVLVKFYNEINCLKFCVHSIVKLHDIILDYVHS